MKSENILSILRVLAWMGTIGYVANLRSQVVSLGGSFYNPVAVQKTSDVSQDLRNLLEDNETVYLYIMSLIIVLTTHGGTPGCD